MLDFLFISKQFLIQAKSTLKSDINGNKTLLQKTHKTEVGYPRIEITNNYVQITITSPVPIKEELEKTSVSKEPVETPKKRSSILSVPKFKGSRESSEERKTVCSSDDRFSKRCYRFALLVI